MNRLASLLWAINLFLDTFGQLSFKAAATAGSEDHGLERWRTMLKNHWIWLGVGTYVAEFFVWMAFLSQVPLGQGVMVSSINIISVMIGGRIFFKEALTRNRVLATLLIAVGVVLVGWA